MDTNQDLKDKEDDTLYMLDIQGQPHKSPNAFLAFIIVHPTLFKVMKLELAKWESLFELLDEV